MSFVYNLVVLHSVFQEKLMTKCTFFFFFFFHLIDVELGQSKDSLTKNSLMDLLLEENEYDDDTATKFQEFMAGVSTKPPPGLDCDEGSIQMVCVQPAEGSSTPDTLTS